MEALFILIPLSLVAVLAAVIIFFKMNSTGQFEDDLGPAMSILLDDDRVVEQRAVECAHDRPSERKKELENLTTVPTPDKSD